MEESGRFPGCPEGACWCRLFGFHGRTPGAFTMRAFFNALDSAFETDLCPRFIELLDSADLLLNLRTLGRLVQQATALVTDHQAAAN